MRKTEPIKHEPMFGSDINKCSRDMVSLAAKNDSRVVASFNGIELEAFPNSDPVDIADAYWNESNRRHQAYISTPEYKQQQAEYEEKDRQKKAALESALAVAPAMEFKDEAGWKQAVANNTDPYGAAVYRYAEKWARLMQSRIATGDTVSECAKETSHLADDEGITGFMYGCAVNSLSHAWIHGEDLRRWHNLDTQIGSEGEKANESGAVLNPAMMTIG